MTQPKTTLKSLLLALGGALLATACTVTLDPNGGGEGGTDNGPDDAQCLDLFETCVDVAGDSPGCEAVFEYCVGSGGDDGGMEPEPGCEDDYINCLAEGVEPEACQPLLDACEPGGGDDGGGCEDDPECEPDPPCADGECGNNCEDLAQTCASLTGDDDACYGELLEACYAEDCDGMLNACYDFGGDEGTCQAITGCYGDHPEPPVNDDCEELLNACYADADGDEDQCMELYPECFEPVEPPEPGQCEWYYGDCEGQFAGEFCQDASQACETGLLPEVFDCSLVFPDYCGVSGLDDSACSQAEEHCWNGFYETNLCGSLSEDPVNWLQNLAMCNDWG